MRILTRTVRPAFSLLEMVMALAIGMLLLLALYVTLTTHIYHVQAGRDVMSEAALVRFIMTRITNDIANQVGPVDPRVLPDYSATTTTTPTSGSTTTTQSSSMATPTDTSAMVAYNVGVRGDSATLVLSSYHVQKQRTTTATNVVDTDLSSDLRRVTYWVGASGADSGGLMRQEIRLATSTDIDLAPGAAATDPKQGLLADEVKTILFEYFDGTTWLSEWDGTELGGPAGDTPIGPPAAIRITLTLKKNASRGRMPDNPDDTGATYQHVVALPTANNFPQVQK